MREFRCFPNGPYTTNTYLVYETGTPFGFVIDPATAWQPLLDEIRHQGIELEYIYAIAPKNDGTFTFSIDPDEEEPGEYGDIIEATPALVNAYNGTA
ncbi:MAG: MBL fold metallo-hydrolase, partial [Firmicutes bacterium]|nr:MBL fold metallo-hydrolase [Bacillota bacterium]